MSKIDELREKRRAGGSAGAGSSGSAQDFVDPDGVDVNEDLTQSSRPATDPDVGAGQEDRSAHREPRRRTKKVAASGRPKKLVQVVYVSEAVKKRFDAQRHKTRMQAHQLVLEAITKQKEGLKEIIAQSRYSTAPVEGDFPEDPSAVRYLGGGSSQIHYNVTPEQDAVLERYTAELSFEKRSTWIAPVLNAYLSGRKDKLPGRS